MEAKLIIALIVLKFLCCNFELLQQSDNIVKLVNGAGYISEVHQVETDDGYLLKVHRVLPRATHSSNVRKPVFLMHGILATAADFLITGPDIALAYLLSDHGYDVWLGNARGSQHSMRHRNLSSESREFWTFSWHEIGFYDLPAMIDYALHETSSSQIFYVGHSQGATSFLVWMSTRPEYNEKITEAHLLAPSAFRKKLPRLRTIIYGLEFLVSRDKALIQC